MGAGVVETTGIIVGRTSRPRSGIGPFGAVGMTGAGVIGTTGIMVGGRKYTINGVWGFLPPLPIIPMFVLLAFNVRWWRSLWWRAESEERVWSPRRWRSLFWYSSAAAASGVLFTVQRLKTVRVSVVSFMIRFRFLRGGLLYPKEMMLSWWRVSLWAKN